MTAPAAVGDTIALHGTDDAERLSVTVKQFIDPASSSNEFSKPDEGKKWVAAQVLIQNSGTKVYTDSPGNGAQVADADGQRFGTAITSGITAGPLMPSNLKLPPGEKALGWIVFEVPSTSKVVTLQFAMDSGFSDQIGQWRVK